MLNDPFIENGSAYDSRSSCWKLIEDYTGPGTIETYTVLYHRDGRPQHGVIVVRTADGRRTLAKVPAEDESSIAYLTDGKCEPVGSAGEVQRGVDGIQIWHC
jgi:acetyl-CoA C-acetyltransferase